MIRNTFSALLITVVTLAHQTLYAGQEHPFPVATPESQGLSSQAVQQLTEAVASYVEDDRVVGAELLVIKNHKTVLHETFGWRDRDDEIPMRMNTIFNIRSMTKPVTGTAAQMLIDEGKLSADDPVAKYLPSFDDDKSRPITVGHLLTHRSGLSRTVPANEPTLRAIADCCGARGPEEFLPGTSYRYSNGGSSTVGAVVEEIAGAPLDEFMARRIFRPLGMNDTLGLHHGADPRLSRAASRYEDRGGKWVRTWKTGDAAQFQFLAGSQGLGSTPMDYARFLAMWMDRGVAVGRRLLSRQAIWRGCTPASMAHLPTGFAKTDVYYGQHWILYTPRKAAKPIAFGHSGFDGTFAWAWPKRDLMVLYFTQCANNATGLSLEQAIDRLLIHPPDEQAEVPDKYEDYIGFYWNRKANICWAILVRDGELTIEVPGATLNPLCPTEDRDRWTAGKASSVEFNFKRDMAGKVIALIPPAYTKAAPQTRLEPDPKLPSIDELMARRLKAHGTEMTGRLGAFRLSGSIDLKAMRMKAADTLLSDGDGRSREEVSVAGSIVQTAVCNGDHVWVNSPTGDFTQVTGSAREQIRLWKLMVECLTVIGMAANDKDTSGAGNGCDHHFGTTHWSVVLAAGHRSSSNSDQALSELCRTYWYPLYAYVRRRADNFHEAQDLTQEFFARLLEKEYLKDVDPERGKFRSFLLAAMKHFLSKERSRARAQKRGGGRVSLSLDFRAAEGRYSLEPTDVLTPERLYERRWALTLLDQVIARLQQELAAAGKGALFERLKVFLTSEQESPPYRQVAEQLGMTEGATKVAVHRLRRRYRELMREQIAQTVSSPEEIDDELRQLFAAVRSERDG